MGKDKKKRKPSAYNKHVGREMRAGKTMKQAAASWKRKGSKPKSGGTSRKPAESSSKTGGRRLGKSTFNTNKIFGLITKAALIAPAASVAMDASLTPHQKVRRGIAWYTGFNIDTGAFKWEDLLKGWAPYVGTKLARKVVAIIGGIF